MVGRVRNPSGANWAREGAGKWDPHHEDEVDRTAVVW